MHRSICELQEVNKDVLLGKKTVNCLSCNKGNDGYEALSHVKGQDGRLYVGSGHAKAEDQTYTDSPGNAYPSKSAYPVASPQNIVKSRHKTSLSMSVHNGAQMFATKSGPHLLNDDSVQLNFKSKANIFGTIIEDRYKRETKLKQSLRNSIIDRSSNKFLTAETSKNVESKQRMFTNISAASGNRKKLPIGFLI